MTLSRLHPRHFWSAESGLTGLLIFFLGYLIILFSLSDFSFGRLAARLLFSLIIVAGVLTIFKQRWLHGLAILLAVAILALTWVEEIRPGAALTGHRIRGAIVVYLLLGGTCALLYQVVALNIPQAFRLPESMAGGGPDSLQRQFTYFSFITLTTIGFGDITPVHPLARLLAMFEGLVGQLYPAITLARLVSLAVMHQKEKP
jgi:hypothetical protein